MFAAHRFPIPQTFDRVSGCYTSQLGSPRGWEEELEARKKVEEEENKDILEESNKETVSDGDDQR